jgi:anthranilate synthase component 1
MIEPRATLGEVQALLAEADVAPLVAVLPTRELTPVAAMAALGTEASCFLLESAEGSGKVARWSLLGHQPDRIITAGAGQVDPLDALQADIAGLRVARPRGIDAPFTGGAVGYLAYEAARRYERLPAPDGDPLQLSDAWFARFPSVVVFDHAREQLLLACSIFAADPDGVPVAYARAVQRLHELHARLESAPAPGRVELRGEVLGSPSYDSRANLSRESFAGAVARCLEYIVAGDIFQVQISRRFAVPFAGRPFDLYRAIRDVNPSPYMFYLATPDCTLVGASPEMLVRITGKRIQYHPIAGTRRRGRSAGDDARMEAQLRSSEKERAEHLMLVDLGRNDLGRVSVTGSVAVTQMMEVERYSHVMHLVSSIEGTLADGCTSLDALRACFPAGTVTGAPKIRAMEIIAELEPERRGPYAGAVGYVGFGGDLDTAIALRTIVLRDGIAYAQAAAGIVADSVAHEEALEIDNKVSAQMLAIAEAAAWSRR